MSLISCKKENFERQNNKQNTDVAKHQTHLLLTSKRFQVKCSKFYSCEDKNLNLLKKRSPRMQNRTYGDKFLPSLFS